MRRVGGWSQVIAAFRGAINRKRFYCQSADIRGKFPGGGLQWSAMNEVVNESVMTEQGSEPRWASRISVRTCDVLKRNMVPGLILQVFVIAVVGSYYLFEPVAAAFNQVARLKLTYGFAFSAVSTSFFGGLIPFLVQKSRPKYRKLMPTSHVWFFVILWAFKGMEVDLLYRCQAMMFGEGSSTWTLFRKTLFDQFIYVPLWGLTSCAIAMTWRQCGFSFGKTWDVLRDKRWWTDNLMVMMIPNWLIWVVAVVAIYCLPLALQLPVQNLVLCFWCILLIFLADDTM